MLDRPLLKRRETASWGAGEKSKATWPSARPRETRCEKPSSLRWALVTESKGPALGTPLFVVFKGRQNDTHHVGGWF